MDTVPRSMPVADHTTGWTDVAGGHWFNSSGIDDLLFYDGQSGHAGDYYVQTLTLSGNLITGLLPRSGTVSYGTTVVGATGGYGDAYSGIFGGNFGGLQDEQTTKPDVCLYGFLGSGQPNKVQFLRAGQSVDGEFTDVKYPFTQLVVGQFALT